MMEWISVTNKIPNHNEKVLAFDSGRIYICFIKKESEYTEHWNICDEDCSCVGCTGAITHWMALPSPPKD